MTTRTRILVVAVVAAASLVVAAVATLGGLVLHWQHEDDRAGTAAIGQYGDLHAVRDLEVTRIKTWNRCAAVELSYGPDGPVTVTMVKHNGQWVLAETSTEAAYFDTDDVNDESSCLNPRFH